MSRAYRWLPFLATIAFPAAALEAPQPSIIRPWPRLPHAHELVARKALAMGVPSHVGMDRIWHESKFRPDAPPHRNRNGSTDYGIAQLNDRFHPDAASMTVDEQIDEAMRYLAEGGRRCGWARAQWYYVHGHCPGGRR